MVYKQKKTTHILLAFAFILTGTFFLSNFILTPMRINTYSLVFPKEKWLLTHGNGEQIISTVIDYSKGHTTQYNYSQFERGEFVSMHFGSALKKRNQFTVGDTILSMRSSNIQDQLVVAEGDLQVAIANLNSQSSAQKESIVKEAESRLKYIEEKIVEQEVLVDRTKQLFEKGYSSKQEFELQKWNLDLLQIEKKILLAQLENYSTGVKPAEVKYLQTQISAIKLRLDFLKKREAQLSILAPINGITVYTLSPDTLLNIVNSRQLILQMPIRAIDIIEFKVGQKIPISFSGLDYEVFGTVASIDKEVKFLNRQQIVLVSVLIENSSNQFLPGMIIENSLNLRKITLLEQLGRFITN
jgi:hypothetical protein